MPRTVTRRGLRKRTRLRRKEVSRWRDGLVEGFGAAPFGPEDQVDRAEGDDLQVLLVKGRAVALLVAGDPVPTVRALLEGPVDRRYVTVDMGAVPHVTNGADVMAPGIVAADPAIVAGDLVWVRDERNGVALAVGRSLQSGPEMVAGRQGRAVETLHHVGDWVWKLAEE